MHNPGSTSVRTAAPIGYLHAGNSLLNRRSVATALVLLATLVAAFFLLESTHYVDRGQGPSTPFNAQATGGSWPYLVTLGDSITEYGWEAGFNGWVSLLANHYLRYADVRNRGFSGYTSRNILRIIHTLFPLGAGSAVVSHPPELVTVFFGANDAVLEGSWIRPDGIDQHVPPTEYQDNLHQIINHLRTIKPSLPIILISPPPPVTRGRREYNHTRPYIAAIKEVGDKAKVPVIDTWALLHGDDPEVFPTYLVDGLHFNDKGNGAMFDAVIQTIAEHYPALALPEGGRLPRIGPNPGEVR